MINSITRFNNSIQRIKSIHSLYVHLLEEKGFEHQIISDILRSEMVYSVAALDRLVHDLVLAGIMEIYSGTRPSTPSYNNLALNLNQFNILKSAIVPEFEFKNMIIQKHKYLAFQEPDKISQALSIISLENHKWQKIAGELGITMSDLKIELKNIVLRRNQIVHESDIDLLTGNELDIVKSDVEETVLFIENLGLEIYNLVK